MFSVVAKVYNPAKVQEGWVVVDEKGNLTMVSGEQVKTLYQSNKISEYCPFNGVQITSNSYNTNMFKLYTNGTPVKGSCTLFIVNSIGKVQNGNRSLEGYTVLRLSKVGLEAFRYSLSDMQTLYKASYTALNGRMMSDGRVVPKVGQFPRSDPMTMEECRKYCEFERCFQGYRLTRWKGKGEEAMILPFVSDVALVAFDNCKALKNINVDKDNKRYVSVDGVLFSKDMKWVIRYPLRKQGEYVVPDSVEEITERSFIYCTGLTSITIGNGVKLIRHEAFYGCTRLVSVTIGKGVKTIGDNAFAECNSLRSITLPKNCVNSNIGDFLRRIGISNTEVKVEVY